MGFFDRLKKKNIDVKNKSLNNNDLEKEEKLEKKEEFLKKNYNFVIKVQKEILKESEISYSDFCGLTLEEIDNLVTQIKKRGIDKLKDNNIKIRDKIDEKINFDGNLSFLKGIELKLKNNIIDEINNKNEEINDNMDLMGVIEINKSIAEIYNKIFLLKLYMEKCMEYYEKTLFLLGMSNQLDTIKNSILVSFDYCVVEKYSTVKLVREIEKLCRSISDDLKKKKQIQSENKQMRNFNSEFETTLDGYYNNSITDDDIKNMDKYLLEIEQEKSEKNKKR